MAQLWKLHLERDELLMMVDALQEYRKHHKRVVVGNVIDQYALYIDGALGKCKKLLAVIDTTAAETKALQAKEKARLDYKKEIQGDDILDDHDDHIRIPDLPELPV